MFADSQCLLKMSAGLDFPSLKLNWRYPAALASLTPSYEAKVDSRTEWRWVCLHCQLQICYHQTLI